jgi:hypothetical protein
MSHRSKSTKRAVLASPFLMSNAFQHSPLFRLETKMSLGDSENDNIETKIGFCFYRQNTR